MTFNITRGITKHLARQIAKRTGEYDSLPDAQNMEPDTC